MSTLDVRKFEGEPAAWDAFVEQSNNGTLFHRLAYLAYHRGAFADSIHHLAWSQGGTLRAVMPLAIRPENGVLTARSPYGASYGGIVVGDELSLHFAQELVRSLVEYLRGRGVARLVVVPPPGLNFLRPHDYLNFWLIKQGATCPVSELTSYIEVVDEPLETFSYSAVKAVRKARANDVTIEESTDTGPFYEILAENRRKFGAKPTHTEEEIGWLLEALPDHVKLFLAKREGTAIAGSLVFRVNRKVILDFYWAHLDEYQGYRPISLLVYEITRWAHRGGYRIFDFGTQTIDMEPVEGSTKFKETFGAVGVFRKTYDLRLT